ncbi:NADP oxidoreductase [Lentzea aerocolonigenes]|uniref:NADP oxidoreductase n=1 Tax=Lentzea aerocolonigenes TaxID=68170 RepID=A0A0F0GBT7_LENAE|nr:NAD(P)-binding domain-containing protein [Lentzea aerocolonigenes]KJK33851.1 NADP oxidoreductase [Lentzea aerocolonigenes]
MRIGIIGAGQMARALGNGWAAAGHEIRCGRRGEIRETVEFGEVTLLAVPVSALTDVLSQAGFDGRTVIDCTNAFEPDGGSMVLGEDAVAERIAKSVPGARVVKAFNLCAAEVWAASERVFEGRRLAVPLCGDDEEALVRVEELVRDLKAEPVRAGGLSRARYLEAMSAFVVGLWFAGADARAVLPPLEAAFAVED